MKQKLIDQLIHKAGARFGAEGIDYSDFTSSKFAELIVRECMDIAINASSDTNFITGISEADKRALSIAVEIRNHFGVKE